MTTQVDFEYELGENYLRVTAGVTLGRPAHFGPSILPEDSYPAEGSDVELVDCILVDADGNPTSTFDPDAVIEAIPISFNRFRNLLRVLLYIEDDGLGDIIHGDEWQSFRTNPCQWMIETDSISANQVFRLMIRRENFQTRFLDDTLKELACEEAEGYGIEAEE